ncbi:hypothetical protein HPB47_002948 [Ixodes persulcatus]|uniref:Uncharacterized protein n=1 Tax=Ixodes persulcatus TaxID=34615 RepID=A0AC60PKU8_IXOPE|nr:hypothetical protein HPB47_002948 [Ixodes persulcatus]
MEAGMGRGGCGILGPELPEGHGHVERSDLETLQLLVPTAEPNAWELNEHDRLGLRPWRFSIQRWNQDNTNMGPSRRTALGQLLVVIYCCVVLGSKIRLEDQGYVDIVVVVDRRVPEDPTLITNLQDGVTNIDVTQNIKEYIMANTVECLI